MGLDNGFDEESWSQEDWDENNNPDQDDSTIMPKNPFGVESVDALVYGKSEDSPELRMHASYVPIAPKLKVKDSKPVKPMKKTYEKWVPGKEDSEEEFVSIQEERKKSKRRMEEKEITPAVRIILIVGVAIIPLMVGWFLIQAGLNLY